MANEENDLLATAIANTETEIFSEAVGRELPDGMDGQVDRSVEEMGDGLEGQHEPQGDEDAETGENTGKDDKSDENRDPETGRFVKKDEKADGEGDKVEDDKGELKDTPAEPENKSTHRVPVAELTRERKARQELERKLQETESARETERTQARSEFERLNARLDAILAGQGRTAPAQPQQTETPAPSETDLLFEDPAKFVDTVTQRIERQFTQKFVSADLARTHEVEGDKFTKAYEALTALPKDDVQARATVQRIWASPTPGRDIIRWHEQQESERAIRAAGGLDKMRENAAKEARDALAKDPEFRKQLLADMQAEARGQTGGTPRVVNRLPRSLNGAAGGTAPVSPNAGRHSADNSDRGVFEDVFRD